MKNKQALQVVATLAATGLMNAAMAASPVAAPVPRPVQIKDLMPIHKPNPTPVPVAPAPVQMPAPRAQLQLQPGTNYGVAPVVVVPLKRAQIEIKGPDLHPQVLPPEPGIGLSVTMPMPERK